MGEFIVFAEKYKHNYFEIMIAEDSFTDLLKFLKFNETAINI
jgi:hypothetical protein